MILSEADAVERFGKKLTIASLAVLEKSVDSARVVEVRIIHDGTNGVDVNRFIKVRDGGLFPTTADVKACLRSQAESSIPHFGLTADVKEAHRLVAVREFDWAYQACRVREGGELFINTRGTYGIASAAYWWGRLGAALHRLALQVLGPLSS